MGVFSFIIIRLTVIEYEGPIFCNLIPHTRTGFQKVGYAAEQIEAKVL